MDRLRSLVLRRLRQLPAWRITFYIVVLNFKAIMLYLLFAFAYGKVNAWQQRKKSRTDGRAMDYREKR